MPVIMTDKRGPKNILSIKSAPFNTDHLYRESKRHQRHVKFLSSGLLSLFFLPNSVLVLCTQWQTYGNAVVHYIVMLSSSVKVKLAKSFRSIIPGNLEHTSTHNDLPLHLATLKTAIDAKKKKEKMKTYHFKEMSQWIILGQEAQTAFCASLIQE